MASPSNITALVTEAALFSPGYERNFLVVPRVVDRRIEAYRPTQTTLLEDPHSIGGLGCWVEDQICMCRIE